MIAKKLREHAVRYANDYGYNVASDLNAAAARIEALETALKVSHQNCLALWEALEGGASPRCRDCADFNGRCQGNGPACDPQERALERIKALRGQTASHRSRTNDTKHSH
jgi:hypothetical protein